MHKCQSRLEDLSVCMLLFKANSMYSMRLEGGGLRISRASALQRCADGLIAANTITQPRNAERHVGNLSVLVYKHCIALLAEYYCLTP